MIRQVHRSGEHIDAAISEIETSFADAIAPEFHEMPESAKCGAS
jgi:hypothetical protein